VRELNQGEYAWNMSFCHSVSKEYLQSDLNASFEVKQIKSRHHFEEVRSVFDIVA
jgi:hypothetical protein